MDERALGDPPDDADDGEADAHQRGGGGENMNRDVSLRSRRVGFWRGHVESLRAARIAEPRCSFASIFRGQAAVDFFGERLDSLAHGLGDLGELGVLTHQHEETSSLGSGQGFALLAGVGEIFAVLGIGIGVGFIAVRLASLR